MPPRRSVRPTNRRVDDLPVDVFLDGFAAPMRAIADDLRDVVRRTLPEATERVRVGWRIIGFDLPAGRRNLYFAWVFPERVHVHLGFPHGDRMGDRDGLLEGAGITKRARWLTFRPGDRLDEPLLRDLLLEAAAVAGVPRTA